MLNKINLKFFSRSFTKVLLVKDYPRVGFEGEIADVKPGFANIVLYKNYIAVPYFPGIQNRLYPDFSEKDIEIKRREYDYEQLLIKFNNQKIIIYSPRNNLNPNFLNKELQEATVLKHIADKFKVKIKKNNLENFNPISMFGVYKLNIIDFKIMENMPEINFEVMIDIRFK